MGIKYCKEAKEYTVSYHRRHPQTKRSCSLRRKGIKTKVEAEKVYKQLIVELTQKFYEAQHPLWIEVVEGFLIHFTNQGMAKNTILNYRGSLRLHTYKKWHKVRIHEISTGDIRDLIQDDLSNFSEAYRKSMLKYIRAVFRYATEHNIIHRDPSPRLKFKKNEKIKKVLTESQMKKLLQRAKEENHPWFSIWALACYTGLRNGELYALKWERVDLNKRIMVISSSWTKENGFKETKSGDDRIVEIAKSLMPLMKELKERAVSDYVLPRIRAWDKGSQASILKDFLFENDLPVIRFHDLRASWATVMLSKGIEPIKVMSMGGWKDLKTMQIYIRKSGIHIQGITDGLNFM